MTDVERAHNDFKQIGLTRIKHGKFRVNHAECTVNLAAFAHGKEIDAQCLSVELRCRREDKFVRLRSSFSAHRFRQLVTLSAWKHGTRAHVSQSGQRRIRAGKLMREH